MFISSSNIVLCMGVLLQVLLCVLYIVAVVIYAPIQNDNKVISSTEKKKYKTISVVLGVTISMVAIALYGVLTTTALTISLTLFAVTLLMALVMIRKRGDYNEKD
jgi:quinol-cytochrome oxidoreductase complex cytochrome b subunit